MQIRNVLTTLLVLLKSNSRFVWSRNISSAIEVEVEPESLRLSAVLSQRLVLVIALQILKWHHFAILCKNRSEQRIILSWTRNEDFKFLMDLHQATVDIVNTDLFDVPKNITSTESPYRKTNFLFFQGPTEFLQIAKNISDFHSHSWLIMTSLEMSQWENELKSVDFTFHSEIFLALISGSDQYFCNIFEVYKITRSSPLKILELCTVSLNGDLIGPNCLEYKYQRRRNLENLRIKVVGVDIAKYILSTSVGKDGKLRLQGGLLAEVFLIIAKEINVSYSLHILKGYSFGAFINGSWTGMIGLLSRDEVDMSCSEISMVTDRLKYIGFSKSFMSVGRRIYIRRTLEMISINWQFFANPFSTLLLLSVALSFFGLIGVLWISIVINKRQNTELKSIHEVSWIVVCAFCQKGAPLIPNNRSAKIIFATIYVTFLIIYTCYSATLTSQLTFAPPVQLPFSDLNGLLGAKGWSGGPIKGDLTQIYMEKTCPEILALSPPGSNTPCELLVKLWKKVVAPKANELPTNFREGLAKVLKEKFAFVATSFSTRDEINTELSDEDICNIQELDGDHVSSNLAFGLRKDFPIKGLIDFKLLQLQQFGVFSRLKNFWLPTLNKDCSAKNEAFVQITISDFAFAPILVLLSILISSIIFVFEVKLCLRKKNIRVIRSLT